MIVQNLCAFCKRIMKSAEVRHPAAQSMSQSHISGVNVDKKPAAWVIFSCRRGSSLLKFGTTRNHTQSFVTLVCCEFNGNKKCDSDPRLQHNFSATGGWARNNAYTNVSHLALFLSLSNNLFSLNAFYMNSDIGPYDPLRAIY